MNTLEYFNTLLLPIFLIIGTTLALIIYKNWRRDSARQLMVERDRINREDEQRERTLRLEDEKLHLQRQQSYSQREQNQELFEKMKETFEEQNAGVNSGGYIILDLPEQQQSLFHDMLKGFEDYAKLKGYSISFSVDNSIANKIAFKFTINEGGVSVGTNTVRKDIKEYIDRIKAGDDLNDIPEIINPLEHGVVLTSLKNRISFLQHNYQLQQNAIEFYESFLKRLNSTNAGINTQPSVFVQTGGVNQPQSYLANNSPNSIQGQNIQEIDNSIRIADSFNERKIQVDNLEKLIGLIQESESQNEKSKTIIKNLENVKDEITEEQQPDKKRIEKWLKKAKTYFDAAKFGKDVIEFGHGVFESFDLTL